ncbi:oxidoreductase [Gorillibacterium massiliense]|uniref:oxidoreductase n=1 Tax=Gorillibacterium massiliense TaxID=1280390 RepID=UPI0004BB8EB0|nr:oxidoreductase [Gorillibacterium massiliense]
MHNEVGKGGEKSALLLGASGLVGNHLLQALLADEDYGKVAVLVRRPLAISHPRLTVVETDFDNLDSASEYFAVDDVFCCLGTTIKKAGSQIAFSKVDLEYPLAAARLAAWQDVRSFHAVSSLGADAKSRIFYSRTKGLMEAGLKQSGIPSVHIYRPSLLLGKRKEHRPGEETAAVVSRRLPFLFSGPFRAYKPIPAETVAKAMLAGAQDPEIGFHTHPSKELFQMAEGLLKGDRILT